VALAVPGDQGPPPERPPAPAGPKVQDNTLGRTSQARTFQDLLKDAHDERLFEYYALSQLVSVKVRPRLRLLARLSVCLSVSVKVRPRLRLLARLSVCLSPQG
jgi:hypothetical protein